MTILEHIYAIQNIANRGAKSDDAPYSNELILHYLNVSRQLLIKREADKKKFINPANSQGFCVPLCPGSWVDCCNMPEDLICTILKSSFKLPRAVSGRTNLYIKVSFLSGKEIGRTTHRSFRYNKYSIFKKDKPGWFILNDYLYVVGIDDNDLKAVWVDGLLEDPTKLAEITTCGDGTEPCYDAAVEEYPMDGYLIDGAYKMVLQYLGVGARFPEDTDNNARATEVMNDKEE